VKEEESNERPVLRRRGIPIAHNKKRCHKKKVRTSRDDRPPKSSRGDERMALNERGLGSHRYQVKTAFGGEKETTKCPIATEARVEVQKEGGYGRFQSCFGTSKTLPSKAGKSQVLHYQKR